MEPYLTRDGRYLLFNSSNAPGVDTDLHVARVVDELTFAYQGPIRGANSPVLDGVPTLDDRGERPTDASSSSHASQDEKRASTARCVRHRTPRSVRRHVSPPFGGSPKRRRSRQTGSGCTIINGRRTDSRSVACAGCRRTERRRSNQREEAP
jgi:hypothetical protein